MYIYIYTHTHIYVYIYIYIYTHTHICKYIYIYIYTHTHIYIYVHTHTHIYIFIQHVKACAIPCTYKPPTRGDNTVSVAQGSTATPGATKQLLSPDRVLREFYIYIYIFIRQINSEQRLHWTLFFIFSVKFVI